MSITSEEMSMLKKTSSMLSEAAPDPTMTQMILDHPLYPLLQMVFQKCELATSSPRDSQSEAICSSDSFSEDIRTFINDSRLRNIPLTTGVHEVDKFMLKSIEVLRIHLLELEKVHQLCDNFCQRYINCLKGKLPIDLVVDDGSSRDTNSTSRNGNHQQDGGPSSNPNSGHNNTNSTSSESSKHASAAQNGQQQEQNGHHQQQHNSHNSQQQHSQHQQHQQQHLSQHAQDQNNNGHQQAGGMHAAVAHDAAAAAAAAAYHHSSPYGAYGATGYGGSYGAAAAAHHAAAAAYAVGQAAANMPHHYQQAAGDHLQHHSPSVNKHEAAPNSNNNHHNHNHHHHHHHHLNTHNTNQSSGSSSASSVKLEHANGQQHYACADANSQSTAPDRQLHDDVRSPTGSTGDASLGSGDGTECEDDDNRGRRQQKKRGIFPKAATNIMRAWLFQHLNHPYPSEDQKKQLAEETGLTILQVNNWFINARRRIVQPMIDQSNRTSGSIMAGPAYSPDASMGYMLGAAGSAGSTPASDPQAAAFRNALGATDATGGMGQAAYAAMSAMAHSSQYRTQQSSHAAMLGLSASQAAGVGAGAHMMGAHPALPPPEYY